MGHESALSGTQPTAHDLWAKGSTAAFRTQPGNYEYGGSYFVMEILFIRLP